MKRTKFKKLLSELESLTHKQKTELSEIIKQSSKTDKMLSSIGEPEECKHCESTSYYKWGKESGIQRYKFIINDIPQQ